ncbi:MAG: hypothetical protein ABW321_01925 [Polyangiales bacterium]
MAACSGAACSGAGQDGLITVGIRPTVGEVPTSAGNTASGTGGLPVPGSDVMNPIRDGNTTPIRSSQAAGALASAASDMAVATPRGGAMAAPDAATSSAGSNAAGAGGSRATIEDECGAIPAEPAGKVTAGWVTGGGLVEYDVDAPNMLLGLRTTLTVPAKPPPSGQVFIWPGIQPQPNSMSFQPIGNGALLPVLTWGPSCAPESPGGYASWWIAPTYSNLSSSDPQYAGCHAGKVSLVEPEQRLDIAIRVDGTTWIQTVVNRETLEAAEFTMDLKGQTQGRAIFDIGLQTSNKPTEDVVFTHTVLSMDMSDPDACRPTLRGTHDFASKPRVSADGLHCCIDRIVLRAPGVAATTLDPP